MSDSTENEAEAPKPRRRAVKPEVKASAYAVAPNKAINTKRGVLVSGATVSADDFVGGKSALDQLVNAGVVVSA